MGKTLYEKIWETHQVYQKEGEPSILYVDNCLIHEATTAQAFEGMEKKGRKLRRVSKMVATIDHVVSTVGAERSIKDSLGQDQAQRLRENCAKNDITFFDTNSPEQGVIHVIAAEKGFIHPGNVVVCADSHTATHGAFGAYAVGIGTSELEHVLTTQTLRRFKSKSVRVNFKGKLRAESSAKDMVLKLIAYQGNTTFSDRVIEFAGETVRNLSMEGRMTLCNMAVEMGARTGVIAPDKVTFEYLQSTANAPGNDYWDQAVDYWKQFYSDEDATFDEEIHIDSTRIVPQITWGTSPFQVVTLEGRIPSPQDYSDLQQQDSCKKALEYMEIKAGTLLKELKIDAVFIGSCTNGRIEDLRASARILKGKKVHSSVTTIVVPASGPVKKQAELEGLDQIFKDAGCEWREPGCSYCLAMNCDSFAEGVRSASTSNRNFEGRQGKGSRTHLVSPMMAAVAAIEGRFGDVKNYLNVLS